MSVYKKLMAARLELQSRKLNKSGHNNFAGYSYFELGDFLPAVQEIFAKHELCGVISYGTEIARLTIVDMSENGGSIEVTSPMSSAALKGCHEVQNLGAVQTYIRRYLWVAAMEIVEHDALDSSKPIEPGLKEVKKQGGLSGIGNDLPEETKEVLKDYAAQATEMVTAGEVEAAIAFLRAQQLETDERLYVDRFLDSKVRSAMSKIFNQKKAA
jgi:hypothetical protein